MGADTELQDPNDCGSSRRLPDPGGGSHGKLAQVLSGIPNWVSLAGGIAMGKLLGPSSSSSSMEVPGVGDRDLQVSTHSLVLIISTIVFQNCDPHPKT